MQRAEQLWQKSIDQLRVEDGLAQVCRQAVRECGETVAGADEIGRPADGDEVGSALGGMNEHAASHCAITGTSLVPSSVCHSRILTMRSC
jgi:hypothetical protein